jgi:hypothetical protein
MDALMELLECNPLLADVRAHIERVSCGTGEALPNGLTQRPSNLEGTMEEGEADDALDDFESGLYLCRWPNGDVSIVKADSKREAAVQLDEWTGAEPAWLVPLESCMIDFHLNDEGGIELTEFGEETAEFIWESCYPQLDQVLSSVDVLSREARGSARNASKRIRTAVQHGRRRLWRDQPKGAAAKTALGRKLQKRLRTVGPVADHYIEFAAGEILRGKAGENGKPN